MENTIKNLKNLLISHPDIMTDSYIKIFNLQERPLYKLPTNKIEIYQHKDTNVYAFPILVAPRIFNTKILTEQDTFDIPNDVVLDNQNNKCLIIIDNVYEHTYPLQNTKNDTCRIFYNVLENTIKKYNLNTESMVFNVNNYNPPKVFNIDTVACNLSLGVEFYENDMEKYHENVKNLQDPQHRPYKLIATNSRPRKHRCDFAEFVFTPFSILFGFVTNKSSPTSCTFLPMVSFNLVHPFQSSSSNPSSTEDMGYFAHNSSM